MVVGEILADAIHHGYPSAYENLLLKLEIQEQEAT